VCLGAASFSVLATLKRARHVDYERGRARNATAGVPADRARIEATGLAEACDFARLLRERVVMAEGRHERELQMRADADARLKAAG
jgi:hypothetical protein